MDDPQVLAHTHAREAWAKDPRNSNNKPKVPPAPMIPVMECPDPLSPGATGALYAAAYRRTWAILMGPDTTPQDVVSILSVARLGARVGADKVAVKRPRLRAASMLPPKDPVPPTPGT